jgi:hypothetical protein
MSAALTASPATGSLAAMTAAAHGDTGRAKLMAHRGRRDAQLGTDLAQSPALGV